MANPTAMSGPAPAVVLTGTAGGTLTLESDRDYVIGHDGETDTAGVGDSNTIYLAFKTTHNSTNTSDPDGSEGSNKAKLIAGRSFSVGPGCTELSWDVAAGTPTFTIIPGKRHCGAW